ncbi:hypothetical protein TorRG33x02_057440 [Trema orientale]|uniref:Uncharacterized protein n=1 Tax=Trema orientale TaxID=63057 RepID=A0A2P5FL37_TREOI|nr:hypothetical protein TorRG33x02_057440 [Trema orientale]
MKKESPSPYNELLSAWMVKEKWVVKSVTLPVLASQSCTGFLYVARPVLLAREPIAWFLVSCRNPFMNASPSKSKSSGFVGKEVNSKETELPFVSSNQKKVMLMRREMDEKDVCV